MGSTREPAAGNHTGEAESDIGPRPGCSRFISCPLKILPSSDEPLITRTDVNCATTCNIGSRRGSEETRCRRPAHRKALYKELFFEETGQIWIEAGFLPPADYRRAVALLHRLAMDEEGTASLLSSVLTMTAKSAETGSGYRILDPVKLRRTAEDYGIEPAGRSDGEIAHAVTMAIIGEYGETAVEEHA
ncbi:hypothetical protein FGW20_03645 [Methanoculleus sp. FWC-SCC3]|uniref:Uncharacterized protein n=1 Tax=Methanoculleus methanifontis TaxID=2584086 RepID=A0ABT8M197_9EURY|nr:hypothetical protein [Methanoculleus sp. FWC-SCC3]